MVIFVEVQLTTLFNITQTESYILLFLMMQHIQWSSFRIKKSGCWRRQMLTISEQSSIFYDTFWMFWGLYANSSSEFQIWECFWLGDSAAHA